MTESLSGGASFEMKMKSVKFFIGKQTLPQSIFLLELVLSPAYPFKGDTSLAYRSSNI
jgi:hypothetical protein